MTATLNPDPLRPPETDEEPWPRGVPVDLLIVTCPECGGRLMLRGTITHNPDGSHDWIPDTGARDWSRIVAVLCLVGMVALILAARR